MKIGGKHMPAWLVLPGWATRPVFYNKCISLAQLFEAVFTRFDRHEIPHRAAGVAFHFTLSIFPAILFFFSLISYVPISGLQDQIFKLLANLLPTGIYQDSLEVVADILLTRQGSILSIGIIGALYASTAGMTELIDSFNSILFVEEKRSFLKRKMVAMALTFTMAFAMLFAIVVIIVGEFALDWLEDHRLIKEAWSINGLLILQYLATLLVFVITLAAIYYYGPAGRRRWHFFSLGAFVASGLVLLLTRLFSVYISRFATYNKLYGSIGTFMGFMLWLWLVALVMLVGFEINASIEALLHKHRLEQQMAEN